MSGVLLYDGQSALATLVAERLHTRAPAAFSVRRAEDAGVTSPGLLRWEEEGLGTDGVEALLRALAAVGAPLPLERFRRSAGWRRLYTSGFRWGERNRGAALWFARRWLTASPPAFAVSAWLFLRVLALTFFIAFVSLAVQVRGLFGSEGIVPLAEALAHARRTLGARAHWELPSWLHLGASDAALVGLSVAGALLSLLLAVGVAPRVILALLVSLYLSFVSVGAPFLSFQWDTLLIETGFLAIFLAPGRSWAPWPAEEPPRAARWLLKWLLFRLMLLSGVVKLTSGDPSWREFTALDFHLWTQPLPSLGAFWMAKWGSGALRFETAATLVIELLFPFLLFGNRPLRRIAALGFFALLAAIAFTGSYGFLGILTAALCVLVMDDQDLRWLPLRARPRPPSASPRLWLRVPAALVLLVVFVASVGATWARLRRSWELWPPLEWAGRVTGPLLVANSYGMFEVMTKERLELSIEGSEDGQTWAPYVFRYKPDALEEPPRYAAPHMPRLDWMMWFAALGHCQQSPWLFALQYRLLEGTEAVEALFEAAPEGAPPAFTRINARAYRFDLAGDGYWTAGAPQPFCPAVTLRNGRLVRAQ